MWKKLIFVLVIVCVLMPRLGASQEAKAVLEGVTKAMGDVKSLQYAGSGANFAFGQNVTPGTPWPRFNVKSYTRMVNYDTPAMQDTLVRTQAEPAARGGGGIPMVGEQRQNLMVSGTYAWTQTGENPPAPALAAVADRQHQLWITPHGVIKAAMKHNATVQVQTEGGKKMTTISFMVPGQIKVKALVNERNLVEKVDSWNTNPVLGDMLTETTYADYKDFGGVQFPTKITQKQGGFPSLELTVSEVKPNAPVDIQIPDNVRQASVKVETDKIADGVWYVTGGTHHSVLVEMNDHLVVIEGPQDDARATAVIAEVKKTVPNKPIKYVVNTHHHFDHSGGLRTYVAHGATVVTHQMNKEFYEDVLLYPSARMIEPDLLSQRYPWFAQNRVPAFETVNQKYVLSDGNRILDIYPVQGLAHNANMLMIYLPKDKILINADLY
jgi:glyoxylase-like metal-dependent hydrolase (beta-lactamase superfamily II)